MKNSEKNNFLNYFLLGVLFLSCSKEYKPNTMEMGTSVMSSIQEQSRAKSSLEGPDFTIEQAFPGEDKEIITMRYGIRVEKLDSLYIYQGDVILNQNQVEELTPLPTPMLQASLSSNFVKYWPNSKVYYQYSPYFNGQSLVEAAIDEWEAKTGLEFIYGTGTGNYIEFQNNSPGRNSSQGLGMKGGMQYIRLDTSSPTCGHAIHEIGHAIGLFHEHCRSDRDDYVIIHENNIDYDYYSQFDKTSISDNVNYGPFDFNSVMLYSSYAWSFNRRPTITKLDGTTFTSQRDSLSTLDALGVCAIYGPPYHKLVKTLIDSDYRYDATHEEWNETWNYSVYFYSDRACTIPAQLVYPRRLKLSHTNVSVYYGERDSHTSDYIGVAPAGSSSYSLGTAYISMHSDYGVEFGTEEYYELLY